MWAYIDKKNTDAFFNEHNNVSKYFEDLCLFESEDKYFLPRYIHQTYPSNFLKITSGDEIVEFKKTKFKFIGKLREKQEPLADCVLQIYKTKKTVNGVIKAFPGIGKTVMSIFLAAKIGLKTCIVVDNTNLVEQWIKAILTFTDLEPKDIGLIQQNLFEINKPICIAMVQTLQSKIKSNFNAIFKKIDDGKFGLVIYDEVHKSSSAPQFSKSSLLFRTKNIIGLSASPFHYGVHEILMTRTIGEIIYETSDYDLTPKYYFVYYNSLLKGKQINSLNYVRDVNMKRGIYNKIISDSKVYSEIIKNFTQRLLKVNHKIIIICSTQKQVEVVSDKLTKSQITNRKFYGKQRELDRKNDKVLVATYSYAGAGFDFKELSALILACPLSGKKSIIQVVGRILRTCENKKEAFVLDLIDLAAPSFFMPMVKTKKKLILEEFNCKTLEIEA